MQKLNKKQINPTIKSLEAMDKAARLANAAKNFQKKTTYVINKNVKLDSLIQNLK